MYQVYYLDNGKKKVEFKCRFYEDAVKWVNKLNHAYGGILQIEPIR